MAEINDEIAIDWRILSELSEHVLNKYNMVLEEGRIVVYPAVKIHGISTMEKQPPLVCLLFPQSNQTWRENGSLYSSSCDGNLPRIRLTLRKDLPWYVNFILQWMISLSAIFTTGWRVRHWEMVLFHPYFNTNYRRSPERDRHGNEKLSGDWICQTHDPPHDRLKRKPKLAKTTWQWTTQFSHQYLQVLKIVANVISD